MNRAEYKRQYRLNHLAEIKQHSKQYYLAHKEKYQYSPQYYLEHKDRILASTRKYQKANPQVHNAIQKRYYYNHQEYYQGYEREYYQEHKETILQRNKQWKQEHRQLMNNITQQWKKTHPERVKEMRRKEKSKRRQLNFNPWNKPFKGCVGHHLTEEDIIYIPKELHQSIQHNLWTGKNMSIINDLAIKYLEMV